MLGDDCLQSFEDYLKEMINEGYITEDGTPLKCQHCDSTNFTEKEYYEDGRYFVVERLVTCTDCKKQVGLWSYGVWEI